MRHKTILIIILLVASLLRLVAIDQFPAGLNADEAAIGYNAYSLIQAGKDEFGHPWPINFQSFNDYKPGLYFYFVLPFVKVLGLNEWAVRLPSAILGIISVWLLYCLVSELFRRRDIALISALVLAVSPWHLHFSRGGWESNAALFFILAGVYFFVKSIRNSTFYFLSSIFFILSMYTYHSARLITPLLAAGLILFYWKALLIKKQIKLIIATCLLGVVLMFPLLLTFKGDAGTSRFSGVGLFADSGPFWRANELRAQHVDYLGIVPTALHNRYLEYLIRFADNYMRHFSGDYLFISGDEIQRNRVPETGQMLLITFPILMAGLYFLVKNKPNGWQIILLWLGIAPLASALTFQSPHAIRSLNMVIPLSIIIGYGGYGLHAFASKFLRKRRVIFVVCCLLFVVCCLWNVTFYLHQYYVHYPQTYPSAWEYGFEELGDYLKQSSAKYEQIYITNKYDQPYIEVAFFTQYPPEKFQKEAILTPRDQYGFSTVNVFGKYVFGSIVWSNQYPGRSLLIGTPSEIPNDATIIKRIYFKDGKTEAFRVSEK